MTKSPVLNGIETLWQEMDRAFTGLLSTPPVTGFVDQASHAYPAVRLHEGPDALYVEAIVPGVDSDTLKLSGGQAHPHPVRRDPAAARRVGTRTQSVSPQGAPGGAFRTPLHPPHGGRHGEGERRSMPTAS